MKAPFADYSVAKCQARIRERNDRLNAVLHVIDSPAPSANPSGPLHDVPYVLKDTWDTAGIRTTAGSWRYRDRVPPSSCHAHRALEKAGAVLLGKSNLSDLAFSTESDNHIRGPVRNPFDETRAAGGSTGGVAAIADGMAAFDWGSDFGGSIRGPAAWCGVVGLRLSTTAWPVGFEHFPRIPPPFWTMCGMGPIARDVAGVRAVMNAVRDDLRVSAIDVPNATHFDRGRVAIWAPDNAHRDDWPTFVSDVQGVLDRHGIRASVASPASLPTPTAINALFLEMIAAHFDEMIASGDLPLLEGLPAVLLSIVSGGRLDRRVHPNTASMLLGAAVFSLIHRDKKRVLERVQNARDRVNEVWASGALIVSPTTSVIPPRHGRAAFAMRSMSFCKLGNLVDATGLAIPCCGTYAGTRLPKSLQILGPAGSEDAVLDLGERLLSR